MGNAGLISSTVSRLIWLIPEIRGMGSGPSSNLLGADTVESAALGGFGTSGPLVKTKSFYLEDHVVKVYFRLIK